MSAASQKDTSHPARSRTLFELSVLLGILLLVRLPFLYQAIGGDDVYYLAAAYHGLIDPLHPNHTTYVFEGRDVNFQGFPHPPGNAWFLCALVALFGDVREPVFHAAYLAFSVVAVVGMYALARRFSLFPFWATALFITVPAFFVNGNLLESDVPLGAFWTAGAAAFIWGVERRSRARLIIAGVLLGVSGLIGMQAAALSVVLLAYLWLRRERFSFGRIIAALAPFLALCAWQLFERLTSGVFPFSVSTGYLAQYGYERFDAKVKNALGLTIHAVFLVFPILLPFALRYIWNRRRDPDVLFLVFWSVFWLLAASVLFYSGSARYLLPMAPAVVLLLSHAPRRWVILTFALQLAISLGLATVNYQHWGAYRKWETEVHRKLGSRRVWVDAEWGLRHYFEADGALPSRRNQWIPPGEVIIQSELAYPAPFMRGGSQLVTIADLTVNPVLPFRLIGVDTHSGYSSISKGFLPYGFLGGAIDHVHAYELRPVQPALTRLLMNAPAAETQILYGIDKLEDHSWRWMGSEAAVLLKNPGRTSALTVHFYVPQGAKARRLYLTVVGGPAKTQIIPAPGSFVASLSVSPKGTAPVTVRLGVDQTFRAPGDQRDLGVILNEVGFTE